MYTIIAIIVIIFFLVGFALLYSVFRNIVKFFVTGLDTGFSVSDVRLLWKVAKICDLREPVALFFSMAALTKCMTQITKQAAADRTIDAPKTQTLLSKLFAYRTKIQNESNNKKGLSSTEALEAGQLLRIILPGKGVFASNVIANGKMIIISLPKQKDMIVVSAENWVGKVLNIYFWRKGDAQYVFDSVVLQQGIYTGKSALYLKQSYNLTRTQKRRAIRAKCEIYAELFFVKKSKNDNDVIESKNGFKCLLEDISESGALIKIGGKGRENIKIKLQFSIKSKLIIMLGIVRKVDYNEGKNLSYLHFECTHIEQSMKNEILAFVYNMLPESEKEVIEAIKQMESDEIKSEAENSFDSEIAENSEKQTDGERSENSAREQDDENNLSEDYDSVEFKY